MSLSVITLTPNLAHPLLANCLTSVHPALTLDCAHQVIHCPDERNFNKVRFESSKSDEYTVIVDYDDSITAESLKLCYAAIKLHDLDVVFTDETLRDLNGVFISSAKTGIRTYEGVRTSPQEAHHMVVMRSELIDPVCLELALKYNCGIEWFMHSCTILNGKAMHIPRSCYNWTRHPGQYSRKLRGAFNSNYASMVSDIGRLWPKRIGRIPQANIQELELFIKENNW